MKGIQRASRDNTAGKCAEPVAQGPPLTGPKEASRRGSKKRVRRQHARGRRLARRAALPRRAPAVGVAAEQERRVAAVRQAEE